MTIVDGVSVAPERVRPFYHPVFFAYLGLVEEGKPPTCVNLAARLGRSKQAVSQLFQRHPDLSQWITKRLDAAVGHYVPAVLRRHALLGIQGSVDSAKLYLSAMGVGNVGRGRPFGEDEDDSPEDSRFITHVNILVPHPQLPDGGRMPALGAPLPSTMPDLKDIPTVAVR